MLTARDIIAMTILEIAVSHWYSIGGHCGELFGILSPLMSSYKVGRDTRQSTDIRILTPKITFQYSEEILTMSITKKWYADKIIGWELCLDEAS